MMKQLDTLQIYFGDPFIINDRFKITQPTVRDIVKRGETNYYGMISTLTALPSDYISFLYDLGMNYMEVSDFEFFIMLVNSAQNKKTILNLDNTRILFGDLDFSKFTLAKREQDGGIVLYNVDQDVVIDELAYKCMFDYLCKMHLLNKIRKKAGNKSTYLLQVEDDREDRERAKANNAPHESNLQPLISSMVNHPGFKYNIWETGNLTLYQFMDSVKRIGLLTATERLAVGYYTGNFDQKKFDIKNLDWMKDLQK